MQAISTTTLGLFLTVIDLGLGRHVEAFPPENIFPFFMYMYFYSILIISAYSFIKLSICLFLLRLADRTKWRPFLIGMLGKRTLHQDLACGATQADLRPSVSCCIHDWLNICNHLPVHPRASRVGLQLASTDWVCTTTSFEAALCND